MRILFRLVIFLLIAAVIVIYLFIPTSVTISSTIGLKAPVARVFPLIARQSNWNKWWPANTAQTEFLYNGYEYSLGLESLDVIETIIKGRDSAWTGKIFVVPATVDSTLIQWNTRLNAGHNPVKRVQQYFAAKQLKKDLRDLLVDFRSFSEKEENIYGMSIFRDQVKDTVLVATRGYFNHYPNSTEIYSLIQKLREYIKTERATETNPPMLHVQKNDSLFEVMVALPTSRLLNGKGSIEQKRMVLGKIIWAEVKGGPHTVENALEQLENYRYDYKLTSPAIPFASLVTDRTQVQDSTKWITRVYYPIY